MADWDIKSEAAAPGADGWGVANEEPSGGALRGYVSKLGGALADGFRAAEEMLAPAIETAKQIGEVYPAVEAGANLASQAVALPGGLLAGASGLLAKATGFDPNADPAAQMAQAQDALTFQPISEEGKKLTGTMNDAIGGAASVVAGAPAALGVAVQQVANTGEIPDAETLTGAAKEFGQSLPGQAIAFTLAHKAGVAESGRGVEAKVKADLAVKRGDVAPTAGAAPTAPDLTRPDLPKPDEPKADPVDTRLNGLQSDLAGAKSEEARKLISGEIEKLKKGKADKAAAAEFRVLAKQAGLREDHETRAAYLSKAEKLDPTEEAPEADSPAPKAGTTVAERLPNAIIVPKDKNVVDSSAEDVPAQEALPAPVALKALPGPEGKAIPLPDKNAPAGPSHEPGADMQGLPTKVKIEDRDVDVHSSSDAQSIAHAYTAEAGIPYAPPRVYVKADPVRAEKIAQAYDDMLDVNDPKATPEYKAQVTRAYEALAKETQAQYDTIVKNGYTFEFYPEAGKDPYNGLPRVAMRDLRDNKHLYVYPTEEGYGDGGAKASTDTPNPLLRPSGVTWKGRPVAMNDLFRAVHDFFGHFKEGVGFRADGEENAWRSHSAMYSDEARKAMTSETRGQNSWVNSGPHAEHNRTASALDTKYAPQKAGLMPDWVVNDGAKDTGREENPAPVLAEKEAIGAREENAAPAEDNAVIPPAEEPAEARGDAPPSRKHENANSARVEAAQELGAETVAKLEHGPLRIVDDAEHLPELGMDKAGKDRRQGIIDDPRVQGFYDGKGTGYVIANRVTRGKVTAIIRHEIGEHVRMPQVLGKTGYLRFLKDVQELADSGRNPDVTAAQAHVADQYTHLKKGSAPWAREVAARVVESNPTHGLTHRLVTAVRKFIYKNFGDVGKWALDDNVIRSMVADALRRTDDEAMGHVGEEPAHAMQSIQVMAGNVAQAMSVDRVREIGRGAIGHGYAVFDRVTAHAERGLVESRKYFDKLMSTAAGLKSIRESVHQWETGQFVTDPRARAFFDKMKVAFDQRWGALNSMGMMQSYIDHYFPHLYEDQKKAGETIATLIGNRPLQGTKPWTKERYYDTLRDAEAAGLKRRFDNPADMMQAHLRQMDKAICLHQIVRDLGKNNFVRDLPEGLRLPQGYAGLSDPAFRGKMIPEVIAKDLNTVLAPGLYDKMWWRGFRKAENSLVSAALGFSGFHPTMTTIDYVGAHVADALQRAFVGDIFGAAKPLWDVTTALPVAINEVLHGRTPLKRGSKLVKQSFGEMPADVHTAALLRLLEGGGGKVFMSPTELNDTGVKLVRALRQHAWKTPKEVGALGRDAVMAGLENFTPLIHKHIVPQQKMVAKILGLKFELDRLSDQLGVAKGDYAGAEAALHENAARQIAGRVVKQVDERLGQMNYRNLYMDRTARDVLQGLFTSFGWQVGTLKTIGGGYLDLTHLVKPPKIHGPLDKAGTIQDASFSRLSPRTAYLVGLHAVLLGINATGTYLMTGTGVQSPMDVFTMRTGRTNKDGSPERILLPSYVKDEVELVAHGTVAKNFEEMVKNKVNPIISGIVRLQKNEDYFGDAIYNPEADAVTQAQQIGKYLAKQYEPFAVSGALKAIEEGRSPAEIGAEVFGAKKAPAHLLRTEFNEFMASESYHPPKTPEEKAYHEKVAAVKKQIQAGDRSGLSTLPPAERGKVLRSAHESGTEQQYQHLPIDKQISGWEHASPEERVKFKLRQHLLNNWGERLARVDNDEGQRDALREKIHEIQRSSK